MHTIDYIYSASAETITRQLVFQASVVPKAINIKDASRVGHWFELRLHPASAIYSTNRLAKDRPLKPFWLPMHLHRLHTLGSQVNSKEGLGGCVAIDEDRIVADRAG
jgi:hypothetical protein